MILAGLRSREESCSSSFWDADVFFPRQHFLPLLTPSSFSPNPVTSLPLSTQPRLLPLPPLLRHHALDLLGPELFPAPLKGLAGLSRGLAGEARWSDAARPRPRAAHVDERPGDRVRCQSGGLLRGGAAADLGGDHRPSLQLRVQAPLDERRVLAEGLDRPGGARVRGGTRRFDGGRLEPDEALDGGAGVRQRREDAPELGGGERVSSRPLFFLLNTT